MGHYTLGFGAKAQSIIRNHLLSEKEQEQKAQGDIAADPHRVMMRNQLYGSGRKLNNLRKHFIYIY
jgi:hypothetical protein